MTILVNRLIEQALGSAKSIDRHTANKTKLITSQNRNSGI